MKNMNNIDKKYLISEVLELPPFIEAEPYYYLLKKSSKSMREEINKEKSRLILYNKSDLLMIEYYRRITFSANYLVGLFF